MKLNPTTIGLTFAGGALGTLGRFATDTAISNSLITLYVVNLLGAAALGWFNGDNRFHSDNARAFWSIGLAGGFTTMSGVALWYSVSRGTIFSSTVLVVTMFGAGIVAYWAGLRFGYLSTQKRKLED